MRVRCLTAPLGKSRIIRHATRFPRAIDAAQKLIDGNGVDTKAMQEASKAISAASDAVTLP